MGQFAILGLGDFGLTVVKTLTESGHHVLCVDRDEQRVHLAQSVAKRSVVADVQDRDVLEDLGLVEMDAVIVAIGGDLEASILATLHLRDLGAKRIIAKAQRDDHAKVLRALGVTEIVAPETEMGRKLARQLHSPNVVDFIPLQPGISVRELVPPVSWVGRSVEDIGLRAKWKVELVAIRDASQNAIELLVPADFVLDSNDRLLVIGSDDDLDRVGRLE